jgi:hypothetical protein
MVSAFFLIEAAFSQGIVLCRCRYNDYRAELGLNGVARVLEGGFNAWKEDSELQDFIKL